MRGRVKIIEIGDHCLYRGRNEWKTSPSFQTRLLIRWKCSQIQWGISEDVQIMICFAHFKFDIPVRQSRGSQIAFQYTYESLILEFKESF